MESILKLYLALVLLVSLLADRATAQLPDVLQRYRFIPSRSTLDVKGGFAGVRQKFFVYGSLGLNAGVEGGPHAEFVDVQSWLVPDSPLIFVWHTDHTLNLSSLEGTFWPGDPSRLTFLGVDGQNVPIQLTAVQQGRLLHIVGENIPPCCDFFKYKFDALAHIAPYADFNLDGIVDEQDAAVLANNIGTFAHASFEQGDADGDGDVDGNDFLVWQREIGEATPMSAFASASSHVGTLAAAPVPEPATAILLLAAAGGLLMLHRAHGKRLANR